MTIATVPTEMEIRVKLNSMTKEEFANVRDILESNWSEKLRPTMQVLSFGCLTRFKIKLSEL